MEVDPADYRIDRGAAWLDRTVQELRYGQHHCKQPTGDIRKAVEVIRALEIESIAEPTVYSSRIQGICIEWLSFNTDTLKDFSIRVLNKQVRYARHINNRPVPIARGIRLKGHGETTREMLKWLYGREVVDHRQATIEAEITQGESS